MHGEDYDPWGKYCTSDDWWLELGDAILRMIVVYKGIEPDVQMERNITYSFFQLHRYVIAWIENIEEHIFNHRLALRERLTYQGLDGKIENTSITPEKVKHISENNESMQKLIEIYRMFI